MDKSKIIAAVVAALLVVGGLFLGTDLKGLVCGGAPVADVK
jgi:hypothetical protein